MILFNEQLKQIGILPVVTADTVENMLRLAETLTANGIPCIEITCRTPSAIDAIKAIKASDVDILLAAGTVTNTKLLAQMATIGVDFVVSPGTTSALLQAATESKLPILPGVSSASDIMLCMDHGIKYMKLFPAGAINALALLKSFYPPFPEAQFCPTGGVNEGNLQAFRQLPNVFCVGGSWLAPEHHIANNEWDIIAQLCQNNRVAT